MDIEKIKCDVLCVGGGIAGLMAAIHAAELGTKVVVAEKANTLRSGAGGVGNDHFQCYIPELHGDWDTFWSELFQGQIVGLLQRMTPQYIRFWFENAYNIVKLWESWGIPMRYEGKYEFAGHGFPGRLLNHLKYSGVNQKPVLTRQAQEKGVQIVNRVMVFDLLKGKDGKIVGAIGISTREDKIVVFEAKAVVLATGCCSRLYPSVTPAAENNRAFPLTNTGDGRAMAYRAGAELMDIELVNRHAGPKYLARCGQATWIGVLRDPKGRPVGIWASKPDRRYGDIMIEVDKEIFEKYRQSGRGPIYMDMDGVSKEDVYYMAHWLRNEGNIAILEYLHEEGVELNKAAVEFHTYEMQTMGGIRANHLGETATKGLYAAGDEVYATISHAAVSGWSAGRSAAKYSETRDFVNVEEARDYIEKKKELLEEIRNRKHGATWREVLYALQQVSFDYCGSVRYEMLLTAGLNLVRRIKHSAVNSLRAENSHELMNCLQVLNLLELGELLFIGALNRKESRGLHFRIDYPFTDPLLNNKLHIIKLVDGRTITDWVPYLFKQGKEGS